MRVVGVQPTYLIFQPHWYLSVTKPSHRSLKFMVFILGASSLDHALRKLPAPSHKRVKDTCFTKPGLSLNFNARDSQKTIQYYLHHYLSHRNDFVFWHDAINNSISRHRSNNNRKLSSEQLVNLLLRYRTNICAIIYCRRNGTQDIEESLGSTGILVLNVVKDFISKRKAKDQVLIEKYKELHQPPSLELKTLLLLRRYSANLNILKTRKKRNRLPLKARKAIRNSLQAQALRLQVPSSCKLMLIY